MYGEQFQSIVIGLVLNPDFSDIAQLLQNYIMNAAITVATASATVTTATERRHKMVMMMMTIARF